MVDLKSVCDIIDMQKGTTNMFLGIVVVKTTYKLC